MKKRITVLLLIAAIIMMNMTAFGATEGSEMSSAEYYLFASAWGTKGGVTDIQSFKYDVENQELTFIGRYGNHDSMSVLDRDGDLLFVGIETKKEGEDLVYSYKILDDGSLEEIDCAHTEGMAISDITVDKEHKNIFAVNFESCNLSMLKYDSEGKMELTDTYTFTDQGSYESGASSLERQDGAYPHSVRVMPDGKYLSVCNMGTDRIYIFLIDYENNKLSLCPEKTVKIDDGEGARHIEFSPDGNYAYVNTEMGNTIYVFKMNPGSVLTRLQKLSTLKPDTENPEKGWASVNIVSEDGKYLYVANRGQNNIAAYEIGEDGLLNIMGYYDCYGDSPRGISFGYHEEVIFASCNSSGTISVIRRNKETGELGDCLQLVENIPGSAHVIWGSLNEEMNP